jgi:NADH-quinone oxidoreductase subunit C
MKNNFRLRLKADVDESDCSIETVTSVWRSANFQERETYDMYGIKFNNHPDLRRMYMPEEFEYHPLRKEFPLMGIPGSIPLPKK